MKFAGWIALVTVCGQGFHDPSLLNQKQGTIVIQSIEFVDGTVWNRQ